MTKEAIITLIFVVCVVVGVSILLLGISPEAKKDLTVSVTDSDWSKGADDASVTIVVYGDYYCPACKIFDGDTSEELLRAYPKDLKIVFRHYPLTSIHPFAKDASLAAEAAGMQGKFWEMHNELMGTKELTEDSPGEIASEIGLDMDQFRHDREGADALAKVNEDGLGGEDMSISYTPYVIISGEAWDGKGKGFSPAAISEEIDRLLEQANPE